MRSVARAAFLLLCLGAARYASANFSEFVDRGAPDGGPLVADSPQQDEVVLPVLDENPALEETTTGESAADAPKAEAPGEDLFSVSTPTADSGVVDSGLGMFITTLNPDLEPLEQALQTVLFFWNEVTLRLNVRDYSKRDWNPAVIDPSQPGPCFTARVMALAHIAMHDALVGVIGGGDTYLNFTDDQLPNFSDDDQPIAAATAIGIAALEVLEIAYPVDVEMLSQARADFKEGLRIIFPDRDPIGDGQRWGALVAKVLQAERGSDGFQDGPPFVTFDPAIFPTGPFQHIPDPTAVDDDGDPQAFYAPHWGGVTPFGHAATDALPDFLPEPLSLDYRGNFIEVRDLGEDVAEAEGRRSAEDTEVGIFYAYDGAFRIGVPPRLYSQIANFIIRQVITQDATRLPTALDLAKLYGMFYTAMADSTIAVRFHIVDTPLFSSARDCHVHPNTGRYIQAWRDKYRFNFWRPVIGIRNASEDTVAGTGDLEEPDWTQLGAPLTNLARPGINPAFPAYPSGHATIGTSAMTVLQMALNIRDDAVFEIVSDEFNGVNMGADGQVRPLRPRSVTIPQVIEENQRSRVFLGVHWDFDSTTGGELGTAIAQNIVQNFPARAA